MMAYHFEQRPILSISDAQALLPAREDLWDASTKDEWEEVLISNRREQNCDHMLLCAS